MKNKEVFDKEKSQNSKFFLAYFFLWLCYVSFLLIKLNLTDSIESTDSYFYLKIAELSAEGKKYTNPVYSPGYSWLIVPLLKMGLGLEVSGRIISLLCGAGTIILTFFLSRKIFPSHRQIPVFSAILLSITPKFVWASYSTLPYTTATFFFLLAIYLSLLARSNNRKLYFFFSFFSGFFIGISYVVRPEMIVGFFVFAFITRSFRSAIFFAFGFFVSSLPYHIITFQEGNLPSIISKFLGYRLPSYSAPTVEAFGKKVEEEGFSVFLKKVFEIKKYVLYFAENIHLSHKYAISGLLTPSLLILMGMGTAYIFKEWEKVKSGIYITLVVIFLWCIFIFPIAIVADYFFIPILPMLSIISAFSFELIKKEENVFSRKNFFSLIFFFFVFSLNVFYFSRPLYKDEGRRIYKIAGKWLKENFGEKIKGTRIFEPMPFATFYSGGIWVTNPEDADIWIMSSLDYTTSRGKPELIIFPNDKIEEFGFAKPITEIRYGKEIIRIFIPPPKKNTNQNEQLQK